MRIAITADPFIPVPPINYGGIERIIHFLVEGLVENGHEVLLIAHQDSDVSVDLIKYPLVKNDLLGQLKLAQTIYQLKNWKPDLIHSFSRLAYLIPFLRADIPKLMSYQRDPTISQIKLAMKLAKKNTLYFTGCSNHIRQKIDKYAGAFTVYNGIDLKNFTPTEIVEENAPLVFLGRIEPIKGTDVAIKAAIATNRSLIIAGNISDEYQIYFNEHIKPFLNSNITYVGPVNDFQKNEILSSAAAILMPISWEEPFGIVMAEAMACGTPVIGYRRGAVPEIVTPRENGFIANDFNELCSFIQQIEQISRKAVRKSVEEKFSSQKIVNDYIHLYQQLIQR